MGDHFMPSLLTTSLPRQLPNINAAMCYLCHSLVSLSSVKNDKIDRGDSGVSGVSSQQELLSELTIGTNQQLLKIFSVQ